MNYAYQHRRPIRSAAPPRTETSRPRDTAAQHIPNSALADTRSGGMGTDALRSAMRDRLSARFGRDYENSQAEAEADRIGNRFSGASGVEELKERMGNALGADFSGVRFHTGAEASAMAASAHAEAFTSGGDVYLGGPFHAATAAHELVHTVQQGAVPAAAPVMSAPAGAVQYKKKEDEAEDEEDGFFYRHFIGPHREALDQYNNFTDDYLRMGRGDRFKWALQNPIAWIRGGGNSLNETDERNAAKREEDRMAEAFRYRQEKQRKAEARNAGAPPPKPIAPVPGAEENGGATASAPGWLDMANTAAGDWGTGGRFSMLSMPNEAYKTGKAIQLLKNNKEGEIPDLNKKYAKTAGVFSAVGNASSMVDAYHAGKAAAAEGDWSADMESGGNMAADFLSTASDLTGLGGYDPMSAGLSVIANTIRAGTGLVSAAGSGVTAGTLAYRNSRYKDQTKGLAEKAPEELTDEERYQLTRQRAVSQGVDAAELRAAGSFVGGVSSAVRGVGDFFNAAMPEGPGQLINAAAGVVAGGLDWGTNQAMASDKAAMYRNTVNEETNLDRETADVQNHGYEALEGVDTGKRLPRTKAERVLLKSKGFQSGNMQEAFNAITMHRAKALTERANQGGEEEIGIMKNMYLNQVKNPRTGKMEYNANAVAKKLGYEELPPENPFAEDAEKEARRQKMVEAQERREMENLKKPGAERREKQRSYNWGWL